MGTEATPVLTVTPLRPDWKWRTTSRGFALIGALLAPHQLGTSSPGSQTLTFQDRQVLDHPRTWEGYRDLLHGSVRYRLLENGRFAHEAGPFSVFVHEVTRSEKKEDGSWAWQQGRIQLVCACGWRGKKRAIGGARFMVVDQSRHQCRENFTH